MSLRDDFSALCDSWIANWRPCSFCVVYSVASSKMAEWWAYNTYSSDGSSWIWNCFVSIVAVSTNVDIPDDESVMA